MAWKPNQHSTFQLNKMYNKVAIVGAVAVFGGLTAGDDSYGSPLAPAYGAPAASYNEPATQNYAGYGGLQPSYNPPAPAYKPAAKPLIKPPVYAGVAELDLTPVIIGILVLTGLSLLFPTYVSLSSDATRRRRSADGSQGKPCPLPLSLLQPLVMFSV